MGPACAGDDNYDCRCYFFAAARSTKVLPPFILCDNGASLIWMTTASASTPRFFTSAWVMSRIMPAFCSSVRPAAMLTVISGIFSCSLSSVFFVMAEITPAITPDLIAAPFHLMARQHFSHLGDKLIFAARKLRGAALSPFLIGGDRSGGLGALDQVLDLHLAARLFITALDDHARRIALVGVFELVAHVLRIAEIKLGADFCVAQGRDHLLVIGDAILVEHGHHYGAEFRFAVELAKHRERRLQPRHADRKSRRGYRFAAKTRYQAIIAPAAANRAEPHGATLFVLG